VPPSGLPLAMAATEVDFPSVCANTATPVLGGLEAGSGRLFGVFASNDASGRACHQPSRVARLGVGSLGGAAELFCAGARNSRIRLVGSRECSPAALLDE
jgi:hypothetical protein